MDWRLRRRRNRLAQRKYAESHPWCEVCLAEGRGKRQAQDIHEIIYKSQMGKCTEDNMISLCREDHNRAHLKILPCLYRKDLWRIKGLDIEAMQERLREIRKGRVSVQV